jgi:hypothetical protein
MTTASRLAKQVLQTAKCIDVVHVKAEEKLAALLATRPSYVLFEPAPTHPYTSLVNDAEHLVKQHDEIVAALLDMEMGSGNLREELDKIQAHRMHDAIELDADVDRLRLLAGIDTASITAKDIADSALSLFRHCDGITDNTKLSSLKYLLEQQHEKQHVKNHIEMPFLNITPECRNALKEVKSLCNLLMTLTVNSVLVSSQIDAKQAPRFLKL